MPDDVPLILHLDPKLHKLFIAEADAMRQPALQLAHDLIRSYVENQQAARVQDARMRAEVEQALREADAPQVARVPNEEVSADWHLRRVELQTRADSAAV